MAPTVLVKDLLWRCSVGLGDTAPQFQRFAERDMVLALIDGQNALAALVPLAGSRVDAFKLSPGTRQSIESVLEASLIPADGVTPTDPVRGINLLSLACNLGANGATRGSAITVIDKDLLDAADPLWQASTGTEIQHYVYDPMTPGYFWTVPGVPATPAVWVEMRWNAMPSDIPNTATVDASTGAHAAGAYGNAQSSQQTITVPDRFAQDLYHYILARMWMRDGKYREPAKAVAATQLFVNSINAQVQAITGTNPNLKALPQGGS